MDIRFQLLKAHSKENANLIAEQVLQRPEDFKVLMDLFLGDDELLAQRAAWSIGMVGEYKPELILPHLPNLLPVLQNARHPALTRNIYRVLQKTDVPTEYQGLLFDLAIQEVTNPGRPPAIRVFAMTTALRIVTKVQELAPELQMVIEENMEHAPKAFLSRGRKTLKALELLI